LKLLCFAVEAKKIAIIDAKELDFIDFDTKGEHEHHWQTFELLMNAFESNFKKTNYSAIVE